MKKLYSSSWISSTKPNKQRKYRFNAPLHIKGSFLNVHLSKELKQKYGIRALRVRVGDRVRIMRGQFKKQEGKVEDVDLKKTHIFVAKVEHTKRDGTKARHPIDPSNLLIVELNTDDKNRFTKKDAKPKAEKVVKEKVAVKPVVKAVKSENKTEKSAAKTAKPVKSESKNTVQKK